jgi:DNA-binding response OmpR family regulator
MVILMVLLTICIFAVVDLTLRLTLRRMEESKLRRERGKALDLGLKLDFAEEAKSLKRVDLEKPKARILAVDDEPVILDSFRKILVLAGFAVDTVETGQEALSLVRQRDYDFVFTDLKMPGMDGLDVTKAVHHLRPDVDIAIITGYGTVETAVDSMRFGAVDYVQKPFTEDELVEFANRLLLRRQDRLDRLRLPEIRLVTPTAAGVTSPRVVNVPGGVYVSAEHTWARVEMTGEVRVGLDDFFHKSIGPVAAITLPEPGRRVRRGEPLFELRVDGKTLDFTAPVDGKVVQVNHDLDYQLELMRLRPYEQGWICTLDPEQLAADLDRLTIGADSVDWYQAEVRRYTDRLAAELAAETAVDKKSPRADETERRCACRAFAACFLGQARLLPLPEPVARPVAV